MEPRTLIRKFIADTFFVEDFDDGDSFLGTGIIDSNGMLELVMFVEQQFGIRVDDSELIPENFDAINSLCRFLDRKQKRQAQAG